MVQGLREVLQQILGVLEADIHAHEVIGHTCLLALLGAETSVRASPIFETFRA